MTKFAVSGMSFGHCTAAIEKEIKGADQAAEISCDLSERSITAQSSLGSDALIVVVKNAGYEATHA